MDELKKLLENAGLAEIEWVDTPAGKASRADAVAWQNQTDDSISKYGVEDDIDDGKLVFNGKEEIFPWIEQKLSDVVKTLADANNMTNYDADEQISMLKTELSKLLKQLKAAEIY